MSYEDSKIFSISLPYDHGLQWLEGIDGYAAQEGSGGTRGGSERRIQIASCETKLTRRDKMLEPLSTVCERPPQMTTRTSSSKQLIDMSTHCFTLLPCRQSQNTSNSSYRRPPIWRSCETGKATHLWRRYGINWSVRERENPTGIGRYFVKSDAFDGFGSPSMASLAAFDISTLFLQDVEAIRQLWIRK